FFSSRRRHTRLVSDWSSDVCSSDLVTAEELCPDDAQLQGLLRERLARRQRLHAALDLPAVTQHDDHARPASLPVIDGYEIGELRSEERRVGERGGSRTVAQESTEGE